MKVTIAQLNPVVGDIKGNLQKITDVLSKQSQDHSDLVVFPELFLTGYPPRDLLEKPWFIKKTQQAIDELTKTSASYAETGILVGAVLPTGKTSHRGLYNSALLIYQGKIIAVQHKSLLPTYDVFDESRYFEPSSEINVVPFKNERLGISICEDAWNDPSMWPHQHYSIDPIEVLAKKGATLLINISASPFHAGKEQTRYRLIKNHAKKHHLPFIYVNQIGGNDELIFDGRSFFVDRQGEPVEIFPTFKEALKTIDTGQPGNPDNYEPQDEIASIHDALALGLQDYLRKCGFRRAVLGLSGGIDSAVTCCIAVEALGKENVFSVSMPGPYSSTGSVDDSRRLAKNLDIDFKVVPISSVYEAYLDTLKESFEGKERDITEENIQARIRGNILMALSNKFGCLVLSTGNKSELAVGYCTLYGDMSGGLSVISDVPKTMVYQLADYINRERKVIPHEIIAKAPSAELRPNQRDQDTLPPYDILDRILDLYLEEERSLKEIIKLGFEAETVKWVIKSINRSEYKRRQAAPGLKVTTKAFGVGRRMPIAAKYES